MNNEYCALLLVRNLALGVLLVLSSCGGPERALEIRQYHLSSLDADTGGVDSIRAEKLKRLHGAVSTEEQRDRLGHYYTIRWRGPEGREEMPVRIVFAYRQAATGSEIHRVEVERPAKRRGAVEIRITGSNYLEGGRVLAWQLSYYRGDDLIATRQSYLWE